MGKLRAVFYARVSSDKEEQENSLFDQISTCKEVIKGKDWELVGEYVDDGVSGTSTKKRSAYNKLLEDLEWDKFDIVVAKAQDRLQRNTKDWYIFIDKLVSCGKKLYLYLDNEFYTTDNALITGIKAILAEEYSRDLSKKINNANKRRIDRAKSGEKLVLVSNGMCYGWNFVNGEYVINEKEAELKRYMAKLYLEGNGFRNISRILTSEGYVNRMGRPFNPVTIRNMITDSKNYGTVITNKTHKDFNSKKTIKNPPEEWEYFDNIVPPIFNKDTYDKIIDKLNKNTDASGTRGKKTGTHPLSGKIYCAECGSMYWKKVQKDKNQMYWSCSTFLKDGRKTKRDKVNRCKKDLKLRSDDMGCDNPNITNTDLMDVLTSISNDFDVNRDKIKSDMVEWLNSLIDGLKTSQANKSTLEELKHQESRKNKLTEAYMDEIISKEDYKIKYREIESEIAKLKATITADESEQEIREIKEVIENIDSELDKLLDSDNFVNSKLDFLIDHITKITVNGKHLVIELDLIAGAIIAGKDMMFPFVKGSGGEFIQTEKAYRVKIHTGWLDVKLSFMRLNK